MKSYDVVSKRCYTERKLNDLDIFNNEQPKINIRVKLSIISENYVLIENVVYTRKAKLNDNILESKVDFQKRSFKLKIKTNKKGNYIELSNKPFYDKVRIYL